MASFQQSRNVELSLAYYLDQNLQTDWPGTTVAQTFATVYAKDISLPVVCIRLADTSSDRREIGSTTLEDRYLLIIDIFSKSDAMRLDLSYYIKDKIKEGWTHYNHSRDMTDSAGGLVRTANGMDFITQFVTDARIDFNELVVDTKDRFRHNISVRVRKST